ncbi:kelch-like protein 34 [Nelusetta ayraudi]|uniref:kelch-like protein 34 n=1 Tax=Nelusetta ayraudi TaxID=303726 RepID=UPI003F6F8908
MENYSLLYSSGQRTRLLSGFQRLRSQNVMCDVVLEAGGGVRFPCHRALLAASSDYFWALFGATTAERWAGSVSLPALAAEGLGAVLDFLYSGWLNLSADTLPTILEAARYLQVAPAVSLCEGFLSEGLRVDNCCYYANLAELHALPDALEAAHRTIAREMGALLGEGRAGLLGLNVQSLMAVLDTDEMAGVEEKDLLQLALDWLSSNGPLPALKSNLLLSRLRFGLVAPTDLAAFGKAHRAMATPLVRSQVTRALEYHALSSAQPLRQSQQSRPRAAGGLALLVGGGPSPERLEPLTLAFDVRSRTFSPVSPALPLRLQGHCVCSVGGFLFVLGGEEVAGDDDGDPAEPTAVSPSNRVWRYDPRFRSWQQTAPLLEGRSQFSCLAVEGILYAIGGRRGTPGCHTAAATASVEFYDMATGCWRRGPPMPRPLHGHASAALDGGVYVSGGLQGGSHSESVGSGSRDFLFWDPRGRAWARKAPMSVARFGHRLAAANGHIYALLGMFEPFSDIERYDPTWDHWTLLRPLPGGCFGYGMATTPSGKLLLFGGQRWSDGRRVTGRSVMEYDTRRDTWKEVGRLPGPLTGTECALLALPEQS